MMKRRGLFVCLMSGLLGLLGCTAKKMPEGDLVRVEFSRHGTMAGPEYKGIVEQDSTGTFVIRAMREAYGPMYEKKIDAAVIQKFRQIIEEEKMYKYKESYRPMMEVLDGWGWSFEAKFSDGTKIYSHGSNASPKGNGLARIRGLMTELAMEGEQIEMPEDEDE